MTIDTDHWYHIHTAIGDLQVSTDDGRISYIHFTCHRHMQRSDAQNGVETALVKLLEQIVEIPEIK
jgi:hypothetical protein